MLVTFIIQFKMSNELQLSDGKEMWLQEKVTNKQSNNNVSMLGLDCLYTVCFLSYFASSSKHTFQCNVTNIDRFKSYTLRFSNRTFSSSLEGFIQTDTINIFMIICAFQYIIFVPAHIPQLVHDPTNGRLLNTCK